jgi:hypothetical protein
LCSFWARTTLSPRLTLNDLLQAQVVENGDLLRELARSKQHLYKQLDSCFSVELAFIEAITGHQSFFVPCHIMVLGCWF